MHLLPSGAAAVHVGASPAGWCWRPKHWLLSHSLLTSWCWSELQSACIRTPPVNLQCCVCCWAVYRCGHDCTNIIVLVWPGICLQKQLQCQITLMFVSSWLLSLNSYVYSCMYFRITVFINCILGSMHFARPQGEWQQGDECLETACLKKKNRHCTWDTETNVSPCSAGS